MIEALMTRGLSRSFGAFAANSDINLTIASGARHALIGPNGAGKTTLINLLSGYLRPSAGRVMLADSDITDLPQYRRVKRGMTRTFQINTLFSGLSVFDSIVLALCEREGQTWRFWKSPPARGPLAAEAAALLRTLHIEDDAEVLTQELPYGRQRLLEIGLALATRPRVLLLDEPAAGIPAAESRELFDVIAALPRDVTVVLIEHDMDLVFRFAERITVLVAGQVLTEGTPDEVQKDARVREVYLGSQHAHV